MNVLKKITEECTCSSYFKRSVLLAKYDQEIRALKEEIGEEKAEALIDEAFVASGHYEYLDGVMYPKNCN